MLLGNMIGDGVGGAIFAFLCMVAITGGAGFAAGFLAGFFCHSGWQSGGRASRDTFA